MTLSLFLLPTALLSCLLHFLPTADTGGRDSRRGGAAPQPLLPWGCIPLWCLGQWQSPPWLARQTGGEIANISHCSSCGRTTDRGPITACTQLPRIKGCDLVASLLYEGLCGPPTQIPTTCPTNIHLNTKGNYIYCHYTLVYHKYSR